MSSIAGLSSAAAALLDATTARSAQETVHQSTGDGSDVTPEDILLADDLTDPSRDTLVQASSAGSIYFTGYRDGGYFIQLLNASEGTTGILVDVPVMERDSSISIDARLPGIAENRLTIVGCRSTGQGAQRTYYGVYVEPGRRRYYVAERNGSFQTLVDWTSFPAIKPGNETNTVQLTCLGNVITVFINGEFANTLTNGDLPSGNPLIGVGTVGSVVEPAEARFNNLKVTSARLP
jgi:hypothetical protein